MDWRGWTSVAVRRRASRPGTGAPALYSHDHLHDVTHRRGGDLYGGTAVNYYRHVLKMVRAGNRAVKYAPDDPKYDRLPDDYLADAGGMTTPILFLGAGRAGGSSGAGPQRQRRR